ncbi:MAG: hypothetical protein KF788_06280 [Piscinibacter sp.]|nr:hypothetical protein [Piscinibacter sp.]
MNPYREASAPYPGLRPFEAHEADIFFGREEHTDRLLEILAARHFLAVIGPSGSGKSSLVRAGLLPALALGSLGSGSDWRIAVMRPGERPIGSLAAALLRPEVIGRELGVEAADDPAAQAALAAELRRGPLGLAHAAASALAAGAGRTNLLVLVDQFEEIFTYADAGFAQADESESFVNLLLAACADARAAVHVVITMRTDFLGNCVRFAALPEAINRAQYLTPRLTRAQMERAIAAPAQVFGGDVEPALVTELINATGHNSDQLPLVQHALSRMWLAARQRDPAAPRIGWSDARAVGGIDGALHQHAQSLFEQARAALPEARRDLVERLFRLITERRTGGQDVRRPRTLARLAQGCALDGDEVSLLEGIVGVFAAPDACLLQHGPRLDADSVIDLSHEALIRQWRELAAWVADEARRGADYRRWAERAADRAAGSGSPLSGADLLRALDWWNPDPAASGRPWQPDAAWARRYALAAGDTEARAEFDRTIAFIEDSRAEQQRAAALERERELRERDEAIERARVAEAQRRRARRVSAWLAGLVVAVVASLGVAIVAYQRSQRAGADAIAARAALEKALTRAEVAAAAASAAAAAAQVAEAEAQKQRDRAAELAKRLDAQLNLATRAGGMTASLPAPAPTGVRAGALTLAELGQIMRRASESRLREALPGLNAAMQEFDISTRLRQAHFLAQAAYESGELRSLEEAWTGSPAQLRYEPPSSLAAQLGNTQPGDGKKYRGRGYVSLTGKENYKTYGDALGIDLIANPDLAARWDVGARVFGVYWKTRQLNALADKDDIEGITRRINGGLNGLDSRKLYLVRAKAALGIGPGS